MSRCGFVVSASRPEVAKGKVVYSARMQHMDVIRGERLFFRRLLEECRWSSRSDAAA